MYVGPDPDSAAQNAPSEPQPLPSYSPTSPPSVAPIPGGSVAVSVASLGLKPPSSRTELLVMWVSASVIGIIAAVFVNWVLSHLLPAPANTRETLLLISIIFGIAPAVLRGLAQGFILRLYMPDMPVWTWPLASVAGMVIGYSFTYLIPLTQSGFVGILGCITGFLVPVMMGPLYFITKNLGDKKVIGGIIAIILGVMGALLDKYVISPTVEDTITGNDGLYGLAQTIANGYLLAGLAGVGQWLGLRLYLPKIRWWMWVLSSLVGGAFSGFLHGLAFLIYGVGVFDFVTDLMLSAIGSAFIATATGLVLVRFLLPDPAREPTDTTQPVTIQSPS